MADHIIDGDRQDKFDISFEDLDKLLDSTFTEGAGAGGTAPDRVSPAAAGSSAAAPEDEADLSDLLAAADRVLHEPRPEPPPVGEPGPGAQIPGVTTHGHLPFPFSTIGGEGRDEGASGRCGALTPTLSRVERGRGGEQLLPGLAAEPEPSPLVLELPEAEPGPLPALEAEGGDEARPELAIPPVVEFPEAVAPEPIEAIPEPPTGQLPVEPLIADDQLANLLAELGDPDALLPSEPASPLETEEGGGEEKISRLAPPPAPAPLPAAEPDLPARETEAVGWPDEEPGIAPEPAVPSVATAAAALAARRQEAAPEPAFPSAPAAPVPVPVTDSLSGETAALPRPPAPVAETAEPAGELPLAELAVRQLKAQEYDAAIQILKRLIEEEGMNPDHCFNLSVACTRKRDLAGARAALERALEVDPHYWRALGNLAGLEFEAGNAAAAEKLLRQAIEINPFDANSRQNLRFIRRRPAGGRKADSLKKGRAR